MPLTLFQAGRTGTLAAAFAAAFVFAPAAHAQTMAQPAKAPAPAAEVAVKGDPAKVAAAREFLKAYRPKLNPAFVSAQMEKYRQQAEEMLKKQNPKADVKALMEKRRAEVMARIGVQLDNQSQVIAPYFTLQELKALTAFFSKGVGKKLIDVTPNIQMEMMRRQRVSRGAWISGKSGAVQLNAPASPKASTPPKK